MQNLHNKYEELREMKEKIEEQIRSLNAQVQGIQFKMAQLQKEYIGITHSMKTLEELIE